MKSKLLLNAAIVRCTVVFLLIPMFLLFQPSILRANGCEDTFLDSMYSHIVKSSFIYDVQPRYDGVLDNIAADIYRTTEDSSVTRPLVIFIHGGGFVSGARDASNIPIFCRKMAERGFVVASIDYRLGTADTAVTSLGKAELRAVQDVNSFIRFIKLRADYLHVDSNKIILSGNSAGGIAAIVKQYVSYAELPFFIDTAGVGPLEGMGNLNGRNTNIFAVYDMWGPMDDTTWLKPGDVPIGCIQSIYDPCVPYYSTTSSCLFPGRAVYGMASIHHRAQNVGIFTTLYGISSNIHNVGLDSLPYVDTTVMAMSEFCHAILCPARIDDINAKRSTCNAFPNPFSESITINDNEQLSLYLYNSTGRLVKQSENTNTLDTKDLAAGCYLLTRRHSDGTVDKQTMIKLEQH